MLRAHEIEAFAVEDQSGVSVFSFGASQYHQPQVFVEEADAPAASDLIRKFEDKQSQPKEAPASMDGLTPELPAQNGQAQANTQEGVAKADIVVVCEECDKESTYPGEMDGSTQECTHCHSFVDVGEFDWDIDVGTPED